MSRYQDVFKALSPKQKIAFVPFWMMGDPSPQKSEEIIAKIAESADILELGIPFSDPLADGPAIQGAVNRALLAGTTTEKAFDSLEKIRKQFPSKPIGLLVYMNLILSYGIENFFQKCADSEIDSVLIPELPVEEIELIRPLAEQYNIPLVFLVSTNTPEDRLDKIIEVSKAFIYVVSTPSITGAKTDISPETITLIKTLKQKTDIPLCVGFGISTPEHLQELQTAGADGGIIGSRLVNFGEDIEAIDTFCQSCQEGLR